MNCTSPSSSASSSLASPKSCELGNTCTVTLPGSFFSASSLNLSAAWPLGVASATTWLNLMTRGDWACAAGSSERASTPARWARNLMQGLRCVDWRTLSGKP